MIRVIPMTPAQQGIYFDSQLQKPSNYHLTLQLRVEPLMPPALLSAVEAALAEQPALRTHVRTERTGPVFALNDQVPSPLQTHDLRGQEERWESLVETATHSPFDLGAAPLVRILHGQFADEDRLLMVCHHLIADGASVSALAA